MCDGNDLNSIYETIVKFYDNDNFKQLGKNAFTFSKNFNWLKTIELDLINEQCFRINDFLQGMFKGVGIKLVDFKVEFGKAKSDGRRYKLTDESGTLIDLIG